MAVVVDGFAVGETEFFRGFSVMIWNWEGENVEIVSWATIGGEDDGGAGVGGTVVCCCRG